MNNFLNTDSSCHARNVVIHIRIVVRIVVRTVDVFSFFSVVHSCIVCKGVVNFFFMNGYNEMNVAAMFVGEFDVHFSFASCHETFTSFTKVGLLLWVSIVAEYSYYCITLFVFLFFATAA